MRESASVAENNINVHIMKKIITLVILPLLIIGGVYLLVASIMEPVNFNNNVKNRETIAIERLKDIRTLQVAYKSEYGRFLPTTDSLVDFYKNGQITIVRQIGSMDDSLAVAQKKVRRDSIKLFVRDTLLRHRAATIDSLNFIPFSGGKRVNMEAVIKVVSGVNVPLFEASMSYDDLLKGLDRQLIINLKAEKEDMGRYPGLKVGSVTQPNNNAGNWE